MPIPKGDRQECGAAIGLRPIAAPHRMAGFAGKKRNELAREARQLVSHESLSELAREAGPQRILRSISHQTMRAPSEARRALSFVRDAGQNERRHDWRSFCDESWATNWLALSIGSQRLAPKTEKCGPYYVTSFATKISREVALKDIFSH